MFWDPYIFSSLQRSRFPIPHRPSNSCLRVVLYTNPPLTGQDIWLISSPMERQVNSFGCFDVFLLLKMTSIWILIKNFTVLLTDPPMSYTFFLTLQLNLVVVVVLFFYYFIKIFGFLVSRSLLSENLRPKSIHPSYSLLESIRLKVPTFLRILY